MRTCLSPPHPTVGLQSQTTLSEVQEDLRLSPSPSFAVGLQILDEVLAFWECYAEFAGFCET